MLRLACVSLAAVALFPADDPWSKVKELKGGTERRIFKKAAKQPSEAHFDELTADNLVVVVKNEQVAIAKDDIDRLDYRPAGGSRVTRESKTSVKAPGDPDATRPGPPSAYPGQTTSTSSGLSIGSKPDFQTIYRRTTAPPRK